MTSSLGRALQVPSRLAQLNTPANIPLSYRAYTLYHVDDPHTVERDIREQIVLTGACACSGKPAGKSSLLADSSCTSVSWCYNRDEGSLMFFPQTVAPMVWRTAALAAVLLKQAHEELDKRDGCRNQPNHFGN